MVSAIVKKKEEYEHDISNALNTIVEKKHTARQAEYQSPQRKQFSKFSKQVSRILTLIHLT